MGTRVESKIPVQKDFRLKNRIMTNAATNPDPGKQTKTYTDWWFHQTRSPPRTSNHPAPTISWTDPATSPCIGTKNKTKATAKSKHHSASNEKQVEAAILGGGDEGTHTTRGARSEKGREVSRAAMEVGTPASDLLAISWPILVLLLRRRRRRRPNLADEKMSPAVVWKEKRFIDRWKV